MSLSQRSNIELNNVSHGFVMNEKPVTLFQDINLNLEQGSSYAITGPSGTGKSSLLMLMSGLESPKSGEIEVSVNSAKSEFAQFRKNIGFIFQQFHLLPELTALNNVALPLKLRGVKDAESQAQSWLEKVGLGHRLDHTPKQLSGGEQQRVAIARALVFKPSFIFADEPTGNLDGKSATEVADILFNCCEENGAGLVLVTHSDELAARAQHIFTLKDGECYVR